MFVSYLQDELDKGIEEITPEDLSLYREHLMTNYAPATAAKKLTTVRRFLTFTYMGGATTVNPEALKFFAKSPKVRQDPSYNILTEDELTRMLSAARASNYRDYVLLVVMAGCGLREAEVIDVRVGGFQEVGEDQILLRVRGKGDKIRNVPTSPDLWQLVQRYVHPHQTQLHLPCRRSQTTLHLKRRQRQTSHDPHGPLHSEEVRGGCRHNQSHKPALHPTHRRHQHGRKRSPATYNTTILGTRRSEDNDALHQKSGGTSE